MIERIDMTEIKTIDEIMKVYKINRHSNLKVADEQLISSILNEIEKIRDKTKNDCPFENDCDLEKGYMVACNYFNINFQKFKGE